MTHFPEVDARMQWQKLAEEIAQENALPVRREHLLWLLFQPLGNSPAVEIAAQLVHTADELPETLSAVAEPAVAALVRAVKDSGRTYAADQLVGPRPEMALFEGGGAISTSTEGTA